MRGAKTDCGGSEGDAEARLAELYAEHGRDLLSYALRRASNPEDAGDVVAETFLAAWRRAEDVPAGEEARLWLYGIARHVLANQRRGERRRERLGELLRTELAARIFTEAAPETETAVMRVLGRMTRADREVLMLAGWEELDPTQIAHVLGISAVTARGRLHRARGRLRRALTEAEVPDGAWQNNDWQLEEAR